MLLLAVATSDSVVVGLNDCDSQLITTGQPQDITLPDSIIQLACMMSNLLIHKRQKTQTSDALGI